MYLPKSGVVPRQGGRDQGRLQDLACRTEGILCYEDKKGNLQNKGFQHLSKYMS